MKQIKLFLFPIFTVLLLATVGCGKDQDPPPAEVEENLVVALNPDPGTTLVRALGTAYSFEVVVQSKMPPQGVTVAVSCVKDSDGSSVFSQSLQSSTSPIGVSITNLPFNEPTTVTVDVTSKSKPSNTARKTFKLVRK